MQHEHEHPQGNSPATADRARTVSRYVFLGFVAIALYFLITEHRAHLTPLLSFLPFLLLAACPLLHIFHHRGHNHDDEKGSRPGSTPPAQPPSGSGGGAHQH